MHTSSKDKDTDLRPVGPAKASALREQAKRVSKRLLLAQHSMKLTIVCPITGIVSLIDMPAIPSASLIYEHPLSSLSNARGVAQQGRKYLQKLSTQVLAGVAIMLAEDYNLFLFSGIETGPSKNAILRTVDRNVLIELILAIEYYVHSRSIDYLPQLSFVPDIAGAIWPNRFDLRAKHYIETLKEAIEKPDTSTYVEPRITKTIKPVYTKTAEAKAKQTKKLLRKYDLKAFADDKKTCKALVTELYKAKLFSFNMKDFINNKILVDDTLLTMNPETLVLLINMKLKPLHEELGDDRILKIVELLEKDRSNLKMGLDIDALDDLEDEDESTDEDGLDPDEEIESAEGEGSQLESESSESFNEDDIDSDDPSETSESNALVAPEGLTWIQKQLWLKKANAKVRIFVQNTSIPSVHVYIPTADKAKMGDKE